MSSRAFFSPNLIALSSLSFLSALPIVVALAKFWFGTNEFVDRALIVLASCWLSWRSLAALAQSRMQGRASGLVLLIPGALALPPACFLLVQVGPRPVLLWWLMAGWLAICAGAIVTAHGWSGLRAFSFPLLFLLFALPIPQRLEQPLQRMLQECTTTLAATILPLAGVAVQRQGFVLQLPSGDLGVVEACSGIRSIAALTAIAAFLAYWRGFSLLRGTLFVGAAFPVIIICNAFRVTATGLLQEHVGPGAVTGTPHDVLGFSAVLFGLALLVLLSRVPRPSAPAITAPLMCDHEKRVTPRAAALSTAILALGVTLCAAALWFGSRLVERQQHSLPLEQVALEFDGWRGEEIGIPDSLREMLTYDRACHRAYRNGIGQEIHVWVLFWSGASSVRGYHHPDVCWPNRGWTQTRSDVRELELPEKTILPLTVREFDREGRRQLVCYWTQEGGRVWTPEDERTALADGTPGHRWIADRLSGTPVQRSGRVAVLIGGDLWDKSGYGERTVMTFCRAFASELYRVAPWATPDSTQLSR